MSRNISFDDEKKEDSFQRTTDVKTVSTILNNFADATTAHGIPRIIKRRRIAAKLFWTCVVFISLCIFCYQTSKLMKNYYNFHTNIELVSSEYVEFPAVTICNFNRVKLTKVLKNSTKFVKLPEYMKSMMKELALDYEWMWESEDFFDADNFLSSGKDEFKNGIRERLDSSYSDYAGSLSYSSFLPLLESFKKFFYQLSDDFIGKTADAINFTKEELRKFGHQSEDFILQCTFNKKRCYPSNFTMFQNKQYGNCFTFTNTEKQKGKRGVITRVGSDHGLHLTLFIEQMEYVGVLTEETGVRLAIHPRDILPHPEEVGFSMAPGFSTSIGIRQVELKRLSHPYGGCSNGEDMDYLSRYRYNYSIISCQKKCLLDNMAKNCGCVDNIYDDYEHVPKCQRKNMNQWKCSQVAQKNFTLNKFRCDCPAPCHEIIYNSRSSSSEWPSQYYQRHLQEKLQNENKSVANLLNDTQTARKNLVRVKIYFEELNYELVEQVPKHSVESVLGMVGGLLGLYLGCSLITTCEIMVLVYDLINAVVRRVIPFKLSTRHGMEDKTACSRC